MKPLGYNHFLMSTITRVAEPVGADFERREPRCRICRDAGVRIVVIELLDWRGVPIILDRSKIHRITLAEILRDLARPSMRTVTRKTESPTTPYGSTPGATTTWPG